MERSWRMKKSKCMCMIFIFSSLRSCSKILLCIVPWQTLCKEHGYTVAQWLWATSDQKWETDLCRTENFVPLVVPGLSSRSTTASSSTSSPQDLSVSLDPANVRSNEGSTGDCSKELRGTATGMVFPSGWRTSQRTSRSQKYQHPLKFLMTQIRNVPQKWHHGSTVFILISQKTENQNDKGSLQNANWRSSTSSRKVWWFD